MKKTKRYYEGGPVREGPNENIDDDTRARALAYARGESSADEEGARAEHMGRPKASIPKASAAPAARSAPSPTRSPARSATPAAAAPPAAPARTAAASAATPAARPKTGMEAMAEKADSYAAKRRAAMATPSTPSAPNPALARRAQTAEDYVTKRKAAMAEDAASRPRPATEIPAEKKAALQAASRKTFDESLGGRMFNTVAGNYRRGKEAREKAEQERGMKKYAAGGSVSASRRADGIAQRGKTRGKVC